MRWSALVLLVVAVALLGGTAHAAGEAPRVERYTPDGYTAALQVAETAAPTPAPAPTGNIFDKFLAAFMNGNGATAAATNGTAPVTPTSTPASNEAGESGTPPTEPSTEGAGDTPAAEEQAVPGSAETTNAPAPEGEAPAPEGEEAAAPAPEGEEAAAEAPGAVGEPNHGGDLPADLEKELEAVDAEDGAGHMDGDPNVTDGLAGGAAEPKGETTASEEPEGEATATEEPAEEETAAAEEVEVTTTQPTDGDGVLPATPAGTTDAAPAPEGETPTKPGVPTTRVRAPPMPAGVGKGKAASQNAADYAAQTAYNAAEDNNKLGANGFDLLQGGAAGAKQAWDQPLPMGEVRFAKDVTNVPTPKAADNPALAKPNAPDAPLPAGPGVDTASHGFHDADDRMVIPPQHVVPPPVKVPEEAKPNVKVPRMNMVDGSQVLQGEHTEVAPDAKPRVQNPNDAPLPAPVKLAPTLGTPQPMTKEAYTFQSPYVAGEGDDGADKPKYDWSYPDARYQFGASPAEDVSKESMPAAQPVKVPSVVPGVAPVMPQVPDVKVPEPPTIPATPHFDVPKENNLNLPLLSKRVS